jgi:excisionase family DNA binding protein
MPGELTREEAAEYLGVTKRTMDKWANLRMGPNYRRRGRRTFYKLEDLDAWSDTYQQRVMSKA